MSNGQRKFRFFSIIKMSNSLGQKSICGKCFTYEHSPYFVRMSGERPIKWFLLNSLCTCIQNEKKILITARWMAKGKNEWYFWIAWSCVVPSIELKHGFFRIRASDSKNLQKLLILYMYKHKMRKFELLRLLKGKWMALLHCLELYGTWHRIENCLFLA